MPNTLYYGDNLDILRRKLRDETVDLCYIDPPFNSKRNYFQIYNNIGKDDQAQAQAFMDTWTWNEFAITGYGEIITNHEGRYTRQTIELLKGLKAVLGDNGLLAYLISMTQRVNEIQRVLKPTGSFYLHCDPTASHYLKLMLDSVFCPRGGDYLNEIIWKRTTTHSDSKTWSRVADCILFYAKSERFIWNIPRESHSEKYIERKYCNDDGDGRKYQLDNMTSPNPRPNMMYEWKGFPYPGKGWRYSKETMTKLDSENRVWYPTKQDGSCDFSKRPRLKRYLDEMEGGVTGSIWIDIYPINSQAQERLGYPDRKSVV